MDYQEKCKAMNKASESFVSSAVRMLLLSSRKFPCGFDLHDKYLDSGHRRPPVLKKRSWFIPLSSAQATNSTKTVQNI